MTEIKNFPMEEKPAEEISFKDYITKYKTWAIPLSARTLSSTMTKWGHMCDPEGYNPITFALSRVNQLTRDGGCYNEITIHTSSENLLKDESIEILMDLLKEDFGERKFRVAVDSSVTCMII